LIVERCGAKDLCAYVDFIVLAFSFNFYNHSNSAIAAQDPRIWNFHSVLLIEMIPCAQSAKYFSIIADCTPDVSDMEQQSVIIRYVDVTNENDSEICERFLGLPL
jgi:hypothetical protein